VLTLAGTEGETESTFESWGLGRSRGGPSRGDAQRLGGVRSNRCFGARFSISPSASPHARDVSASRDLALSL